MASIFEKIEALYASGCRLVDPSGIRCGGDVRMTKLGLDEISHGNHKAIMLGHIIFAFLERRGINLAANFANLIVGDLAGTYKPQQGLLRRFL